MKVYALFRAFMTGDSYVQAELLSLHQSVDGATAAKPGAVAGTRAEYEAGKAPDAPRTWSDEVFFFEPIEVQSESADASHDWDAGMLYTDFSGGPTRILTTCRSCGVAKKSAERTQHIFGGYYKPWDGRPCAGKGGT